MGWETIRLRAFLPTWQIYRRFYADPHALFLVKNVGDDGGTAVVSWLDSRLTWRPYPVMDVTSLLLAGAGASLPGGGGLRRRFRWRPRMPRQLSEFISLLPSVRWKWEADGFILFSPARRWFQRPTVSSPLRVRVRLRRGGVDSSNLRQLNRAALPLSEDHTLRLALINARSLANKTFLLNDFFTSRELDFMFLTETWLQTGELIPLSELLPPSCDFLSSPRTTGRGGGLASVFKSVFHCQKIAVDVYSSFELQLFEINFPATVLCAVVYRPPKYNKNFIQDFADFVAGITLIYDRFLIMGDFNIHVCCESKPLVKEFLSLVDSFNLTQSVTGPTHEKGHTLDLVLSCGLCITINEICDTGISDHLPVLFTVVVPNSEISTCAASRSFRAINPLTASQFSSVFKDSLLYNLDDCDLSVEEFTVLFDCICTEILDSVAPLRKKHPKVVSEPWLNDTTRSLRRACRVAERKWKKDKLKISFIMMQDALYKYQRAVKSAKTNFFSDVVASNRQRPQVLFSVFNSLVNPRDSDCIVPSLILCENFLKYFVDKITGLSFPPITVITDSPIFSFCPAVFQQFEPVTFSHLSDIVKQLRPTNCPLDSIPARLVKDVFDTVGPSVVSLVNTSLSSGCVPAVFKHAIVQPLLKKNNLDASILSNFRPISKLPFLSKILERVVFNQLKSFLDEFSIFEKFQSGFKPRHSTETALLRVSNDLLLAVDSGNSAVLVLLDLTLAFDMVSHSILLSRLEECVGIKGIALKWFQSYLTDRSFSVHLGEFSSSAAPLSCGVPQGSILGPMLFSLYMLPLGDIFRKHNISFHCYADDVQIYLPVKTSDKASFMSLLNCLRDFKTWLDQNFLCLNENKTEIVVFGHPGNLSACVDALGHLGLYVRPFTRNLGVIFDSTFKFEKQISSVVKASFFQLRLLAKVKPYLPRKEFESVIHAFITSRLDYCNSLYVGLDQSSLQRLQLVQNAAARLLTGTKKYEHITPVLASLHWLPVRFRIEFKLLLIVFKILHGLAPAYLSELLHVHTPVRALRSSNQVLLDVPRARLKNKGDRAFSVVAPKLWNSLPVHIRTAQSVGIFKSFLKTHLFFLAFIWVELRHCDVLLYSFCLCGSFSGHCEALWSTMVVFKCAI